jgi:hypothetical protein
MLKTAIVIAAILNVQAALAARTAGETSSRNLGETPHCAAAAQAGRGPTKFERAGQVVRTVFAPKSSPQKNNQNASGTVPENG